MKYREFIEEYFLIDDAKTGQLVPFKLNKVQQKYYEELVKASGGKIEIYNPIREIILKARREGFTSLILALFAAEMILTKNPSKAQEISYKEEATREHFLRFRRFLESYYRKEFGMEPERFFETDNRHEIILKQNGASFYVGTASAKTGERGGTLQKLLFSEAAHYPDTERMTAAEILNATMRQVDPSSGWIFIESTANGKGNEFERIWQQAEAGQSRFKPRFYGWQEFYTPEQIEIIKSEFTDKEMFKQEYPSTSEEAFLASSSKFTTSEKIRALAECGAPKKIIGWLVFKGTNYIDQAEITKNFIEHLETDTGTPLYIGIDVAKMQDRTVVTVETDTRERMQRGVRIVTIDSTGAGDFLPDWFEKNSRWYIHRVKINAQVNDIMYRNLSQIIDKRLTSIDKNLPEWSDFLQEMINLDIERKGRMIQVHAPAGGNYHDDFADSWALAELGYTYLHGAPEAQKKTIRPITTFEEFDIKTAKPNKISDTAE